jgi:hypothetical protein
MKAVRKRSSATGDLSHVRIVVESIVLESFGLPVIFVTDGMTVNVWV